MFQKALQTGCAGRFFQVQGAVAEVPRDAARVFRSSAREVRRKRQKARVIEEVVLPQLKTARKYIDPAHEGTVEPTPAAHSI